MDVHAVIAPVFEATSLVISADGRHALVVDPGGGAAAGVARVLTDHDLVVSAVALTHGHPDHIWDAAAVAGNAPVLIGAADVYRLEDPAGQLGPQLGSYFELLPTTPWQRPARVESYPDGGGRHEIVPGLEVTTMAAPGHTQGSTVLVCHGPVTAHGAALAGLPEAGELVLAGDVLFAGSVGRTDLPGGDPEAMTRTLRELDSVLPETAPVIPGHGAWTTLRRERQVNPYLRQALGH